MAVDPDVLANVEDVKCSVEGDDGGSESEGVATVRVAGRWWSVVEVAVDEDMVVGGRRAA